MERKRYRVGPNAMRAFQAFDSGADLEYFIGKKIEFLPAKNRKRGRATKLLETLLVAR